MFHRGVIHKITLAQFFCDTVYIGGTAVCQFLILNMMMMLIWRTCEAIKQVFVGEVLSLQRQGNSSDCAAGAVIPTGRKGLVDTISY